MHNKKLDKSNILFVGFRRSGVSRRRKLAIGQSFVGHVDLARLERSRNSEQPSSETCQAIGRHVHW